MRQDEYTVTLLNKHLCYFKNGLLHREDGPALVHFDDEANLIAYMTDKDNIKDYSLYKEISNEEIDKKNIPAFVAFNLSYLGQTCYYLKGSRYSKEEFEAVKLNNQLEIELPKPTPREKKFKV